MKTILMSLAILTSIATVGPVSAQDLYGCGSPDDCQMLTYGPADPGQSAPVNNYVRGTRRPPGSPSTPARQRGSSSGYAPGGRQPYGMPGGYGMRRGGYGFPVGRMAPRPYAAGPRFPYPR